MLKKITAALISLLLLLGGGLTGYGVPPIRYSYFTVSQPSGLAFAVYTSKDYGNYAEPPFKAGDVMYSDIPLVTSYENPRGKNLTYWVILGEDGYWYYLDIKAIQVTPIDLSEASFLVKDKAEWRSEYGDFMKYSIQHIYSNTNKYLIDPLPDELHLPNEAFDPFKPSEGEKQNMVDYMAGKRPDNTTVSETDYSDEDISVPVAEPSSKANMNPIDPFETDMSMWGVESQVGTNMNSSAPANADTNVTTVEPQETNITQIDLQETVEESEGSSGKTNNFKTGRERLSTGPIAVLSSAAILVATGLAFVFFKRKAHKQ